MFSSLKTKLIFFIALIMAITAAAILYFTNRDVGNAMLRAEEVSAKNVLRFVELNIKGGYDKLLSDKINSILKLRKQLKDTGEIAASILNEYYTLSKKGSLSKKEAQKRALEWIRSVNIEKGNTFVFNPEGWVIAHPDPSIQGTLINALYDMKGRPLAQVMSSDVLKESGDYAVFRWYIPGADNASKKLGYFIPFARWNWTIGSVVDISDIEAEGRKQRKEIIKVLGKTFTHIKIAQTGSVFLFDGDKNVLVHPWELEMRDYTTVVNKKTGNLLLYDFMESMQSDTRSLRYIPSGGNEKLMEAHVGYFKILDWYIVVIAPVDEINLPAKTLIIRQSILIAVIFLGSLIAAFLLVARIARPLNLLASYAKELPTHDFTAEAETESESPISHLPDKFKDEVGRLAGSFVFMETELKKNIRDLMATTAAKERIESELNVAREIQLGILPKIFPAFPECKEFDLYALLDPAKEVGGDLYDFFLIDDDHLCFTVGDVSDKGVPAALFMVITRTLIKTAAERGLSASEIMIQVNKVLNADNPRAMFVTLIVGILNIRTGEVRYANGGHNLSIVVSHDKGTFYQEGISGLVVGAMDDIPYKELSLTLKPGEDLFLYTDGVTEAMNADLELYSDELLLSEMDKLRGQALKDVVAAIRESIRDHAGTAPQSDDIGMLMIRYLGSDA